MVTTNVTMPNITSTPQTTFTNESMYIGFGTAAIVFNVLVLLVFAKNPTYFKKSAFPVGLAVGDVIGGVAVLLRGQLLIKIAKDGTTTAQVSPLSCLYQFTTSRLIGVQLPGLMMFLMGTERVVAIVNFQWYFKNWTNRLAWRFTLLAYVYCFISVGVIWLITLTQDDTIKVPISCSTPAVVGSAYTAYTYALAIICGIEAIVATVISSVMFRKRKNKLLQTNTNLAGHLKRQIQVTKAIVCVSFSDFFLVVIPHIILLLMGFNVQFPNFLQSWIGFLSYALVAGRGALSYFIYFALNLDFRAENLKMFTCIKTLKCCGKVSPPTTSVPANNSNNTSKL